MKRKQKIKVFIVAACFIVMLSGHAFSLEQEYELNVMTDDVTNICVIKWASEFRYLKSYEFYIMESSSIEYITYYLNALELVDDAIEYDVFEGNEFSIFINYTDGNTRHLGSYDDRIYDKLERQVIPTEDALSRPFFDSDVDKQYGITNKNYHRFYELIEALQSGVFIVPEEFSLIPSTWAAGEVERAIEAGLVQKVFQIDYTGAISRVEVCQLIVDLLEQHGYTEKARWHGYGFEDSISSSAAMLHDLGIVNGKTETQFCPYDPITRQELAKLLSNTYRLLQGEVPAATGELSYADRDRIGGWAVESVSDMLSLGILRGNDQNEFQPERMVTKEEVILALLRLHEAVSG